MLFYLFIFILIIVLLLWYVVQDDHIPVYSDREREKMWVKIVISGFVDVKDCEILVKI